jgi:hypothetical protein
MHGIICGIGGQKAPGIGGIGGIIGGMPGIGGIGAAMPHGAMAHAGGGGAAQAGAGA